MGSLPLFIAYLSQSPIYDGCCGKAPISSNKPWVFRIRAACHQRNATDIFILRSTCCQNLQALHLRRVTGIQEETVHLRVQLKRAVRTPNNRAEKQHPSSSWVIKILKYRCNIASDTWNILLINRGS